MNTILEPDFEIRILGHDGQEIRWVGVPPCFPTIIAELQRISARVDPRKNLIVFKLPAEFRVQNLLSALTTYIPSNVGLQDMARKLRTIGVGVRTWGLSWIETTRDPLPTRNTREDGSIKSPPPPPPPSPPLPPPPHHAVEAKAGNEQARRVLTSKSPTQPVFGGALNDNLRETGVRISVTGVQDLQGRPQKLPIAKQDAQSDSLGNLSRESSVVPFGFDAEYLHGQTKSQPTPKETNEPEVHESFGDASRDTNFSRATFREVNLELDKVWQTQKLSNNTAATATPKYNGSFTSRPGEGQNPLRNTTAANGAYGCHVANPLQSVQNNLFAVPPYSDNPSAVPGYGFSFTASSPSMPEKAFPIPKSRDNRSSPRGYSVPISTPSPSMHSAGFTPGPSGERIENESKRLRLCNGTGPEELYNWARNKEEDVSCMTVHDEQTKSAESDDDREDRLRVFMDLAPDEQRSWALSEEDIDWIREQNERNNFG
jgi:hypothetical protein